MLFRSNFDRAHRARSATKLQTGQPVWVKPTQTPGTILKSLPNRSYEVETPNGRQRRNRRLLIPRDPNPEKPRLAPKNLSSLIPANPKSEDDPDPDSGIHTDDPDVVPVGNPEPCPGAGAMKMPASRVNTPPDQPVQMTRSGRTIKPPQRLDL